MSVINPDVSTIELYFLVAAEEVHPPLDNCHILFF